MQYRTIDGDRGRAGTAPEARAPAPSAPSTAPPRFVGRGDELRLLGTVLGDALSGQRGIIVLSGDAGIGKTRLVSEITRRARGQGARVAEGHAYPGEGAPPFWPWAQALHSLLTSADSDGLASAFVARANDIARLVPEITAVVPSATPRQVADANLARSGLADAITSGLGRLAQDRPVVLVLEDVHRVDPGSLFVLQYLAAALPVGKLLVVATYQPPQNGPAVPAALAPYTSGPSPITVVELEGLEPADVADLLDQTGMALRRTQVTAIVDRTAGNPFFVLEMARAAADSGGDDAVTALPRDGSRLLRERLALLPARTRGLLDVVAVAGAIDVTSLGAIANGAAEGLEAALGSGTLVPVDGDPSQVQFRHDLLRDTVLGDIERTRRSELHGLVGTALRADEARPPDEIAAHLWAAADGGLAEYDDAAVGALLAAADRDIELSSLDVTATQLDRAKRIISRGGRSPLRQERQVQLGARWVRVAAVDKGVMAPDVARAVRCLRSMARDVGAVPDFAPAAWIGWTHYLLRGEMTSAHALAADMVQRGHDADEPSLLACGLVALGHVQFLFGRHEAARATLEQALAVADGLDRTGGAECAERLRARAALAPVYEILGDGPRAGSMIDAASDLQVRPDEELDIRMLAALTGVIARDPARTIVNAHEAEDIAGSQSLGFYLPIARTFLGWAKSLLGDSAGEWEIDDALHQLDAMGLRMTRATLLGLRADAAAERHDLDTALGHLDAGLAEAAATGERLYVPELHRRRAELLVATGNVDAGREALHDALDLARIAGARVFEERARATASDLDLAVAH